MSILLKRKNHLKNALFLVKNNLNDADDIYMLLIIFYLIFHIKSIELSHQNWIMEDYYQPIPGPLQFWLHYAVHAAIFLHQESHHHSLCITLINTLYSTLLHQSMIIKMSMIMKIHSSK